MHPASLNETAHGENGHEFIQPKIEILPGTEVMTDIGDRHFIHDGNKESATVLIPQPTTELDDPLNWSPLWKTLVMVMQGWFVITSVIPALSIAPLTPIYMEEWDQSLTHVALLTGVTVILLGYSNFIIIPCSEIFGRRVTLIACALINIASTIWSAVATSYGSFLAARCLNGTGAAANESIMTVVVADIFFLHERGRYVGAYFWCYFVGLFVGPIISGAIADNASWRWFFWACTIAQALNIVGLIFLFPETRRMYPAPAKVNRLEAEPRVETIEAKLKSLETESIPIEPATESPFPHFDESLGKGKPSRKQFNLFQSLDWSALRGVMRHVFSPIRIFFYPIIFWASMSMGSAANALLALNVLQSQALAAAPYNFSPAQVGYANFALVGGGVVGLLIAGPWSDRLSAKATARNHGIREPEMRLLSLIPFIAAALVGLVAFSVGVQNQWPWPAVVIVGFGLVGLQVVAIPTLTITYAIDCYKPATGEIMVIATVCKNTFGFGMTYYLNDWAAADGYIPPVMLLMGMTVGFTLVGMIVFYFYGKTCRRWTKDSGVHQF